MTLQFKTSFKLFFGLLLGSGLFLVTQPVLAQNGEVAIHEGLNPAIEINTAQTESDQDPSVSIRFAIDTLSGNQFINDLEDPKPTIRILRSDNSQTGSFPPVINPKLTLLRKGFMLKFNITSKSDIEWFYKNGTSLNIRADGDLQFVLSDGSKLTIRKEAFSKLDNQQKPSLSEDQKKDLIDALDGYKSFYYDRFDAGWRNAESDSAQAAGYLDFAKAIPLGNGFMVELEGLLSNNTDDLTTYFQVSPLYYHTPDNKFHINTAYQTSLNGDEQRINGRVSYRTVLDQNPIDLTYGYDRLRLKPYLNAGMSVMFFTESLHPERKQEYFYEPFARLLYIIPISEKYTARIDAFTYWRSEKRAFNFDSDNIKWQGTVQLGYGLGNSLQIIGKYSYGTFDFTNETNNRLMVGFFAELLNR